MYAGFSTALYYSPTSGVHRTNVHVHGRGGGDGGGDVCGGAVILRSKVIQCCCYM